MKRIPLFYIPIFLFVVAGCKKDDPIEPGQQTNDIISSEIRVIQNPSGFSPLTAKLRFSTSEAVSVNLTVKGRNGAPSDVVKTFPEFTQDHDLLVLGLYGNFENTIELAFTNAAGNSLGTQSVAIQTLAIIPDMPRITISTAQTGSMTPGFNLVNYFGFNQDFLPQRAFMFDAFGDIRWYLNYSTHGILRNLFYDNGMILLQNGNLAFGDGNSGTIYEIDRLGEVQNSWSLKGFGFHHTIHEKPNGNFLVTVNDPAKFTIEDVILEIDRFSKAIVNTWDLTESLDRTRRAWNTDLANINKDWMHANGIAYDAADDGIIISGRTQGTVKLSPTNEVVWIIAPHRGWATSGNGVDLSQFLLQPLDATGAPILDSLVLSGEQNHPDFEWAWYQHSPIILPNGNVMLFDNGDNRNYSNNGFDGPGSYSRAVEYKIDAENRTIQQVWTYGKERGQALYSRIVSKVLHYETEDHVLFSSGAVALDGVQLGKVVEVNRQGQVILEADIVPPNPAFGITFHNVHRVPLYPD